MMIKRKITLFLVAFIIPCLLFSNNNLGNVIANTNGGFDDLAFTPTTMLGSEDASFDTHIGFYSFDYLDGSIYGVDGTTSNLYAYDVVTGASTANISISFISTGIATDGTDLYLSYFAFGNKNGTIVKMDTSGTEISRIHVNVFDEHIGGLAWDGTNLWGYETASMSLLRINPNTGDVSANISITNVLHGITWFDNQIWGVSYGIDRVIAFNPLTGLYSDGYASPFHHDSGIANNGTHMFESDYITELRVAITELNSDPGEVFLRQEISSISNLDITYTDEYNFITANYSSQIYRYNRANIYSGVWSVPFQPAGITALDENTLLIAQEEAPYNLFTYSTAGILLVNHTALDVMIVSLAFDGVYVWAMGHDSILYKLNPYDMTIVAEYPLEYFHGITFDSNQNIIWAVSRAEDKIKYFDPVKEEIGNSTIDLVAPVNGLEAGLTFTGDYIILASYYAGEAHYYEIVPIEKDVEPEPTPTPTPTPTNITTPSEGLFPGLEPLYEDLVFLGIGIIGTSIIATIIIVIIKKKKA